jgi:hypothetical protein
VRQAVSAAALATLESRQTALESSHSGIEAALSSIQCDLSELHSARESANRAECEVTELSAEVHSLHSASEAALEVLEVVSRRADEAEERLSHEVEEVTALRVSAESAQKDSALALEQLSLTRSDVARVASEVGAVEQLRRDIAALKNWTKPRSLIVSQFPRLFEEFRAKRFDLLWRGSRDGFGAGEFHRRCDGRANTLTLISDTDGNIFGGFTPVEWESREWNGKKGDENNLIKGDDSLQSFLFTLKNPRGVQARKFALRTEKKQRAVFCSSDRGPAFGYNDILVYDNCNANRRSCTRFGTRWSDRTSANDTTIADFFTGAKGRISRS